MNAFRFAVTAKKQGHEVNVFLMGEGVEAEQVINDKFNIKELWKISLQQKVKYLLAGFVLKSAIQEGQNFAFFQQ